MGDQEERGAHRSGGPQPLISLWLLLAKGSRIPNLGSFPRRSFQAHKGEPQRSLNRLPPCSYQTFRRTSDLWEKRPRRHRLSGGGKPWRRCPVSSPHHPGNRKGGATGFIRRRLSFIPLLQTYTKDRHGPLAVVLQETESSLQILLQLRIRKARPSSDQGYPQEES